MSSNKQKELLRAVYDNDLPKVKEIIGSYGLSCAQANGYILLRVAAKDGFNEIAKYLLTMGCKVNSKNSKLKPTETPLHFAASRDSEELVQMLLSRGADIDAVDGHGQTPLYLAVCNGREKIVELLLRNGAYIHKNIKGNTYLNASVVRSNVKIVELLINYGSSVNVVNTSGSFLHRSTPLLSALLSKGNNDIIRLLLLKGADINVKGDSGETPLHVAAERGLTEFVEYFVNHGITVNCLTLPSYKFDILSYHNDVSSLNREDGCSTTGYTPLHLATLNEKNDVIKFLLDHGANVDAAYKFGKTALSIAVARNYCKTVELILSAHPDINYAGYKNILIDAVLFTKSDTKIMQKLLDYGFSIDADCTSNEKFLNAAAEKGYLKIIDDVLKLGAAVNTVDRTFNRNSLLHCAVKNKNSKICQLLLNNKADVDIKDSYNRSPLYYAIENGDFTITKLLLSNGASVKGAGNDIINAFNTAIQNECFEIIELILQHDKSFNVNAIDCCGRTPLYCTALSRRNSLSSRLNSENKLNNKCPKESIAKFLLNKGANVNVISKSAYLPLFEAVKNGFKNLVEIFLEYGADVHALRNDVDNLLNVATKEGHAEIVEILLKCGCDPNLTVKSYGSWNCRFPLLNAAKKGFLDIFEMLLKYGADFMIKNGDGQTALHYACSESNSEIVNVLLEFGCTNYCSSSSKKKTF